jgi:protease-4
MSFAHKVWRLLVAIKDGLVLSLLLLFFGGLYAVLSARPPALPQVREGALLLRLDGPVVEELPKTDWQDVLAGGEDAGPLRERDVVRALRGAAVDPAIKAVVLDMSEFGGAGFVHAVEIGEAIDAVRAAKKPVLAYGAMIGDRELLIAAHASEIWVDPLGGVSIAGLGGQQLYYGKLLERLKVTAHVFRVGTYKDFVEPYIRDSMSEPSRAARVALYDAMWQQWRDNVVKARPKARVDAVTKDPVGWIKASGGDAAKASLEAGLVDHIGTRAEFGAAVARIVGEDRVDHTPGNFAHTPLNTWLAANPEGEQGKAIAVVTVAGEITDDKAGPGKAGGQRIARLIDKVDPDKISALVVRVDSPGGSVTGSEAIRQAILRKKAKGLPVVVSMANVAASGGFWVSTPATRIFAEPGTVTGSIGIFAVIPSFERALEAWGVKADGVRTGPLAGQPDVLTGLTPEIEAMLQANIENGYARFVGLVAESRHKTPQAIDAIAQGRVWDGGTARQIGLVDQFGGLDAAMAYAAQAAKLKEGEWHPVWLGQDGGKLAQFVRQLRHGADDGQSDGDDGQDGHVSGDWAGMIAAQQRGQVAAAVAGVERLLGTRGAQAYCLECPAPLGQIGGPAPIGLWQRVAIWLSGMGIR